MTKRKNTSDLKENEQVKEVDKSEVGFAKTAQSIVILILVVVFIKFGVCDIFYIPSGSMEPTLHGRKVGGDRIFCNRLPYYYRTPERWEVFVFKFPYMQTADKESSRYKGENFIKRCVGLAGERVTLVRGDVFVDKQNAEGVLRQVKPDKLQEKIWIPVYKENFSDLNISEFGHYWQVSKNSQASIGDGVLNIASTKSPAVLRYIPQTRFKVLAGVPDRYVRRQAVTYTCKKADCGGQVRATATYPKFAARCPRCGAYLTERNVTHYGYRWGYPSDRYLALEEVSTAGESDLRHFDWKFVPDLRVKAKVKFSAEGEVFSPELSDDINQMSVKFIAGADGKIEISKDGEKLRAEVAREFSLLPGEWYELEFYRLDGQLRVYIDRELISEVEVLSEKLSGTLLEPASANAEIAIYGSVQVDDLDIDRDIHYFSKDRYLGSFFRVPDDGYMALGDNCTASNDSRDWGPVPADNLVGTGIFVWWPLESFKWL